MSNRYYIRYVGKGQDFKELYEVADSRTGDGLSAPASYDDTQRQVEARNTAAKSDELYDYAVAGMMGGAAP